MNPQNLLRKALSSPTNLRFKEACDLARAFGFHLSRVSGSHHIFSRKDIPELLNLQNVNGKAKPYQVRQLLGLVERYNLPILPIYRIYSTVPHLAKRQRRLWPKCSKQRLPGSRPPAPRGSPFRHLCSNLLFTKPPKFQPDIRSLFQASFIRMFFVGNRPVAFPIIGSCRLWLPHS
jgi:hypothetical protein